MSAFGTNPIGLVHGAKPRVVIVEQRCDYAHALKVILQNAGITHITLCPDAFSAAEALAAKPADLLLCSFDMRPVNAADFVKGIRTAKRGIARTLPVIVTSETPTRSLLDAVRGARADGLLAAPFIPERVYSQIRQVWATSGLLKPSSRPARRRPPRAGPVKIAGPALQSSRA